MVKAWDKSKAKRWNDSHQIWCGNIFFLCVVSTTMSLSSVPHSHTQPFYFWPRMHTILYCFIKSVLFVDSVSKTVHIHMCGIYRFILSSSCWSLLSLSVLFLFALNSVGVFCLKRVVSWIRIHITVWQRHTEKSHFIWIINGAYLANS